MTCTCTIHFIKIFSSKTSNGAILDDNIKLTECNISKKSCYQPPIGPNVCACAK